MLGLMDGQIILSKNLILPKAQAISLFFTDMVFSIPFAVKKGKLFLNCTIDPISNQLNWMYTLPDSSLSSVLPACNFLCEKDPLEDKALYNRSWQKGSLTVGSKSKYTCSGEYNPRTKVTIILGLRK